MDVFIRKLTPELEDDFLYYFDNDAQKAAAMHGNYLVRNAKPQPAAALAVSGFVPQHKRLKNITRLFFWNHRCLPTCKMRHQKQVTRCPMKSSKNIWRPYLASRCR